MIAAPMKAKRRRKQLCLYLGLGSMVWGAMGCSIFTPKEDPTRYFILSAAVGATHKGTPRHPLPFVVGLRPVTVAEYLKAPGIAVRKRAQEIHYELYLLWSEPLNKGIERVLRDDLMSFTGASQIVATDWNPGSVDYEVLVDIEQLDVDDVGTVSLRARWQVNKAGDEQRARNGTTAVSKAGRPLPDDPPASVALMRETLREMAQAVADKLLALRAETANQL